MARKKENKEAFDVLEIIPKNETRTGKIIGYNVNIVELPSSLAPVSHCTVGDRVEIIETTPNMAKIKHNDIVGYIPLYYIKY